MKSILIAKRHPVAGDFCSRMFLILLIVILSFKPVMGQDEEEEDLNVFWKWLRWNHPQSFLTDYMISQADQYYDRRDEAIKELRSRQDWRERQEWVREKLTELVGPFPERSELNPRITGVIRKDGYRVEKIIYESFPENYVSGCLFIPDGITGKAPAILNLIGHEQESFRAELDQIVYLNLVKKGFIVLAIDPIGQGEMVQYYDQDVKFSSVGYSVVEHCYLGNQCFLSGITPARYFAWDGIRGIDYLVSREDVDPERIGVTGFSGGGTITSYIGALDDRVKVAIPCSWSTASRRQIETKGAQDAESLFIGSLPVGITFEDLIEVRAPKPTLMTFTSRDQYLSIQGAREAFQEISKAYDAYGEKENLGFVEDDYKHWMTPKIREAIYAFFMEHLEVEGDATEVEINLLSPEELTVTSTGQVSTSLHGESVFTINREVTEKLIISLEKSRLDPDNHLNQVQAKAAELSGFIRPEQTPVAPFFNGRYQRDGYTIARMAIPGEGEYAIPILLFVPDGAAGKLPGLVYLHPEGKVREAGPGGEIEGLVKKGYVVAAVDVLGVGEVDNTIARAYTEDYTAVLMGRSTAGVQAGDIVRIVQFLRQSNQVDPGKIGAVARGGMCIPLLHAAAFEPSISRVALFGPLISYRSVAMNRFYKIGLIEREGGGYWHPYEIEFPWGVAGALTAYDLPDLIGCLAPRKVAILSPQNQLLESVSGEWIDEELDFPRSVFKDTRHPENLRISSTAEDLLPVVNWLFE